MMFPHFQKYLNPLVRTKKLVNSVFYHPCLSRLASGIRFFKLLRVLSLQNACWIFWIVYSNMWGKNFSIYCVHIPRKSLNLCFFTHAPVPHSKLLVEFFENLFPPWKKRWTEAIKIQSENMKMAWNISVVSIWYDCTFSKCDGFSYKILNNIYQIVWY